MAGIPLPGPVGSGGLAGARGGSTGCGLRSLKPAFLMFWMPASPLGLLEGHEKSIYYDRSIFPISHWGTREYNLKLNEYGFTSKEIPLVIVENTASTTP